MLSKDQEGALPKSRYDFSSVRQETYEECVMRTAGSGGTGPEDPCKGKPRQLIAVPEDRFQYFLSLEKGETPKGNGKGAEFLDGYVKNNLK